MDSKQRRKQEHKCVWCGTPTELKADGSHYTICDACREVEKEIFTRLEKQEEKLAWI